MLALVTAVNIVSSVDRQMVALLLPDIGRDFALTDTQIGQITGLAFPIVYGVASVLVAIAADRRNRGKLIGYSTSLFAAMTCACGLSQGFGTLFLARLGVGLGEAGTSPPSLSMISESFKGRARQLANSVFITANPIGTLCAFLVFGNISLLYGWRVALYSAGILSSVIAMCVLLFLHDHRKEKGAAWMMSDFHGFLAAFRVPSYAWASAGAALHCICTASNTMWLPLFLSRSLRMSGSDIAWLLGLNYGMLGLAGIGIGAMVAGPLRKRSVGAPLLIGTAITAATALTYSYTYLTVEPIGSKIGVSITILLASAGYGPLLAFVQDVTPRRNQAKASAALFVLMQTATGFGSLLIGLLSDALAPLAGIDSLRYAALPVVVTSAALASICYFVAARHGVRDAAAAAAVDAADSAAPLPAGARS